jgi:Sulfotransferase family
VSSAPWCDNEQDRKIISRKDAKHAKKTITMSLPENPSEVLPMTPASPSTSTEPIFIAGISQRSGTNFLYDLIRLHPDCGTLAVNWEDVSIAQAEHLVRYVEIVARSWRRHGADAGVEAMLYEHLGNGIISVLSSHVKGNRLITKGPFVRNLNYFFKLFPRAYLLILVRDGRAVVESRVKSFGQRYEFGMRHWARGADAILRFDQMARGSQLNYVIVKYEDLCNNLENELRRIFGFVGLDTKKYDFAAANNLPVRGSSVFRGKREKEFHWDPLEKTPDFNPVGRWNNWSRSKHERFNWIAGEKLVALGYEEKKFGKDQELLWAAWNKALDLRWQLRELYRAIMKLIKDVLKWAFGADRMSRYQRQVLDSTKRYALSARR